MKKNVLLLISYRYGQVCQEKKTYSEKIYFKLPSGWGWAWFQVHDAVLLKKDYQSVNQAFLKASAVLAVKISRAPHLPETVSAGSATSNGPRRVASSIRLDEMSRMLVPCNP